MKLKNRFADFKPEIYRYIITAIPILGIDTSFETKVSIPLSVPRYRYQRYLTSLINIMSDVAIKYVKLGTNI